MAPASSAAKDGRLEAELDRHPQHVEIGEVHDLAVEIGAPVAIDHDGRKRPEIRKKSGIRNGLANITNDMHETGVAGRLFDAQHRMHHHHHDDADALGVVHPVDAGRGTASVTDVPFTVIGVSFRRGMTRHHRPDPVAFSFIHTNDMPVFRVLSGFPFAAKML